MSLLSSSKAAYASCIAAMMIIALGWTAKVALSRDMQTISVPPGELARTTESAGMRLGPPDAPHVIRVFGAYECAWCREFDATVSSVMREHAVKGRVEFVYYHAQLQGYHRSDDAARAAYCTPPAARWRMHEELSRNVSKWAYGTGVREALASTYETVTSEDPGGFLQCLDSAESDERALRDQRAAQNLGVHSVPAVFFDDTRIIPGRSLGAVLEHLNGAMGQ